MKTFSEWLLKRTKNKGSKLTATGLNAGGQAQAGMRFRHAIKPPKIHARSLSASKLL